MEYNLYSVDLLCENCSNYVGGAKVITYHPLQKGVKAFKFL